MADTKICLCLMAKTIEEDVALARRYHDYIDMVELRADYLDIDERQKIRSFPKMCELPAILTIRRKIDGGVFVEGEGTRTTIFARALAFSDEDSTRKFAYIDFEEDFRVPSLQDAALAFGMKIIRSYHYMAGNLPDIQQKLDYLGRVPYEIPKIAFMPRTLSDVTQLFHAARNFASGKQIICAMGSYAMSARLLANRLGSMIAFCTPSETNAGVEFLGHIDPVAMKDLYDFKNISADTKLFAITGFPLKATSSPTLHNKAYRKLGIDAVYFPIKSDTADEAFDFANEVGLSGLSVTVPHKESVVMHLTQSTPQVKEIGACNTIVFNTEGCCGYNTDAEGFMKALLEFAGGQKEVKHKKVALIGAGGAAKAVAWVLHELGAKACVFNRTISKAKLIAEQYGFAYASLGPESLKILGDYSNIIIQTTTKGMSATDSSNQDNDPLWFYGFSGKEKVMDIVYTPEITPIMARAHSQGCKVQNGYKMLLYQAEKQFELFTNVKATLG